MLYTNKEKRKSGAYPFILSWKIAHRMWKINGIVFISFFLAMVVITCCTALIDNWIGTQKSYYVQQNLSKIALCNFSGTPLQPAQAQVIQKSLGTQTIAVKSQPEQIETPEGKLVDISALYGDVTEMFQVTLSKGRFFTPDELNTAPAVCVVGEVGAKAAGLYVGDTLTLQGTLCEIIGIASLDANRLDVLVPFGTYFANRPNMVQQQTIYCVSDHQLQASDYEISFLKAEQKINLNSVSTAQELQASLQQYVMESIKVYLTVAAVAFLFAILNIYLIVKGKFEAKQYLYAIQRALGAKNRQIFLQILSENLAMAMLASTAAIVSLPTTLRLLEFSNFYYRTFPVIAVAIIIAVATSTVASVLLFRRVVRLSIVEILQTEASKT